MKKMFKKDIKTQQEARENAMNWQYWQSNQSLSYKEISKWVEYFTELAEKFNLTEEFKENGII
jgi:hypothetical protein